MTLAERAANYAKVYAKWPGSWPWLVEHDTILYATWLLGNDYRAKVTLHGAYPPGYLARVMALFPDAGEQVLHAFSGALPPGPYSRMDLIDRVKTPDLRFHQANVCDAARVFAGRPPFRLVVADPQYSTADGKKYGTPPLNRRSAISALAKVTAVGGHLCWLDVQWPMHRKTQWKTIGWVTVVRSTNHRVRLLSIMERQAA